MTTTSPSWIACAYCSKKQNLLSFTHFWALFNVLWAAEEKSKRANEKYFQVIIQNLKKGRSVVVQKGKKMGKCYSWKGITELKNILYMQSPHKKKVLLKEAREIVYWFQISFCSTTFVSQILSWTSDIGSSISFDKCITRKFNFYQHAKKS